MKGKLAKPLCCCLVLAATVFNPPAASAQETTASALDVTELVEAAAPGTRRFSFEAENVDQTYMINFFEVRSVVPPVDYDTKLAVIFVVDAGVEFQAVAAIAQNLSFGAIPPALIVGISYPSDPSLRFPEALLEMQDGPNRDFVDGADAYLAFINEELKPFIAEQYSNADLSDSTIMGHSRGGMLAMQAFLKTPDAFQRYIISSPVLVRGTVDAIASAASIEERSGRVMLLNAESDFPELLETGAKMDELLKNKNWPDFEYSYHIFPGEDHMTAHFVAYNYGLREIFKDWKASEPN